jgi:hypothetical protein
LGEPAICNSVKTLHIFLLYSGKKNENKAGWLKQQFFKLAFWDWPVQKSVGSPSILVDVFHDFP